MVAARFKDRLEGILRKRIERLGPPRNDVSKTVLELDDIDTDFQNPESQSLGDYQVWARYEGKPIGCFCIDEIKNETRQKGEDRINSFRLFYPTLNSNYDYHNIFEAMFQEAVGGMCDAYVGANECKRDSYEVTVELVRNDRFGNDNTYLLEAFRERGFEVLENGGDSYTLMANIPVEKLDIPGSE